MISFIIPAHNEEAWIGRCVAAVRAAAAGETHEILVVDDSSTDATGAIAAELGARVVRVEHRQIAATRNAGARAARGSIFFFVDADTLANATAVGAALAALRGGAVGGGCLFDFDGRIPLWARLVWPVGRAFARWRTIVGGCFVFCTREAFAAAGGFNEQFFASEELHFIRALQRQGKVVIPRALVVTSGRKLRTLSVVTLLGIFGRWLIHGRKAFARREDLPVWYGPRAPDPEDQAGRRA